VYVSDSYVPPSPSWMADIIRRNPLAVLTSNGDSAPNATHVPVVLRRDPPDTAETLAGDALIGHMNRANPHWGALSPGAPVLLVFTGPHAYVSPTVYETTPAAPTWDFTAVHVRGELYPIEDRDGTIGVIRSTVRGLESRFGNGWDMSSSVDYFNRILPGVGAFRIGVRSVEGMFKLSQEQPPEVRQRIRRAFVGSQCTAYNQLAELMSRFDDETS
jgi:transcriptional regulator